MSENVEVARLRAILEARTADFEAGMARAKTAFEQVEKAASSSKEKLEQLTSVFNKFGTALSVGVTAPILLAAKKAISSASDLNEAINKTRVVFDAAATDVEAWARTSVDSVGLASKAALDGASTLGAMMKAQGMAADEAARLSMRLVQLAADARSLYNLRDVDEALQKFRAALIGQFEPLRQIGIVLNQNAVAAEAVAMGLARSTNEVSGYAKILATISLLEKQATVFSGDFARTKDDLANVMVRLKAEIQETYTVLGQKLLPAALDGTRTILGFVKAVNQLPPGLIEAGVKVAMLAAAVGPLLLVGGRLTAMLSAAKTATAALAAGQVTLKNVLLANAPAFAAATVGAASLAAMLSGIKDQLHAIVATAGTAEETLAKAMAKNKEMFEAEAAYLDKLLAAHNLSGERWKFSREQTEENARTILRLIQSVRDYRAEVQAVRGEEARALEQQRRAATDALLRLAEQNKLLREKYGILTRGESQEALRRMLQEFETIAKSGVALKELSAKFLPELSNAVKRHAESYGEADIPGRIKEIMDAWDEAQAGQPAKLQAMIDAMSGATLKAVERTESQVMEWGQRIGRKLSGGFGRAAEEGISYGEQMMRKWAEEVHDRLPIVLRVRLDTSEAESQLDDLRGKM